MKRVRTKHPGVYYREHPSRRHNNKPDRYYIIRHRVDGKQIEEGVGWASEEGWNDVKVSLRLAELKSNQTAGLRPVTLKEKREIAQAEREAEAAEKARLEIENISFGQVWEEYIADQEEGDKSPESVRREKSLYKHWLKEPLGTLPLKTIGLIQLERVKKRMKQKRQSDRSRQYAIALIRLVSNWAISHGLFTGPNPLSAISKDDKKRLMAIGDNTNRRYLKPGEAQSLLAALRERSPQMAEIYQVSLCAGLRFSEVVSLTWGCVKLHSGDLDVLDTKGGKNRSVPMIPELTELFKSKKAGQPDELIFKSRKGGKITQVNKVFPDTVEKLGLNRGITDARHRATFHSCGRATFASWLVQEGVDLYRVKDLLGHSTIKMTEASYARLDSDNLHDAVKQLEGRLQPSQEEKEGHNVVPLRPGTD